MVRTRNVTRGEVSSNKREARYAVLEDKHFRARVNQGSRLSVLANIDNYLDPYDWDKLLDSQLSGVVQLSNCVKFSSQLVHYALQRRIETEKMWETWYMIQGQLRRFSLKEFALVTGLRCGRPRVLEMEEDKKVVNDFFNNDKMTVGELEDEVKTSLLKERSARRRFKLVLLLIVEGVLMGGESRKPLRGWVVRLVENVDRFLEFPWGRIIYETTHVSLNGAVKCRLTDLKPDVERNGYRLMGYPLAFQILLYESILDFGVQFASKVSYKALPRCLRWTAKDDNLSYHTIVKRMDPEDEDDIKVEENPLLKPDEAELELMDGCF